MIGVRLHSWTACEETCPHLSCLFSNVCRLELERHFLSHWAGRVDDRLEVEVQTGRFRFVQREVDLE